MSRVYLVGESGELAITDRVIVDGIPRTNAGYAMHRTDNTRKLVGWPDVDVREWRTDVGTIYLVPLEPGEV
jgi:hypothetical protein